MPIHTLPGELERLHPDHPLLIPTILPFSYTPIPVPPLLLFTACFANLIIPFFVIQRMSAKNIIVGEIRTILLRLRQNNRWGQEAIVDVGFVSPILSSTVATRRSPI